MKKKKSKLRFKSFITFVVVLTFIVLAFSGTAMFLRPEGSIAKWIGWTFLGLNKNQWEGIHTIFSGMFITIIGFHIFNNWKVLFSYIKNKASMGIHRRKELLFATLFVGAIFSTALLEWQPLWSLMNLREYIKGNENRITQAPPVPNAESLPIAELAKLVNKSVEEVFDEIRKDGYNAMGSEKNLLELAEKNNTSPESIYSNIVN